MWAFVVLCVVATLILPNKVIDYNLLSHESNRLQNEYLKDGSQILTLAERIFFQPLERLLTETGRYYSFISGMEGLAIKRSLFRCAGKNSMRLIKFGVRAILSDFYARQSVT